jgi:hypothetical protein
MKNAHSEGPRRCDSEVDFPDCQFLSFCRKLSLRLVLTMLLPGSATHCVVETPKAGLLTG